MEKCSTWNIFSVFYLVISKIIRIFAADLKD